VSAYGNDELIEELAAALNTPEAPHRFQSIAFEPPYKPSQCASCARPEDEVALSWYIARNDVRRLAEGMDQGCNLRKREALRQWWTAADQPPSPPACP
jgi:hypothetical protein